MVRSVALPVSVGALTFALLLPLCGLLHRCGCVGLWAGGETHCNVHAASGPHCPWCEHPVLGAAGVGLTLCAQVAVFAWRRRRGAPPAAAALASAVSLPLAIGAAGLLLWLPTDYPHLLLRDARSRFGLTPGPIGCSGHPH